LAGRSLAAVDCLARWSLPSWRQAVGRDIMKALAFAALVTIFALPVSSQPPLPGGPPKPSDWKVMPQDLDGNWSIVYVEIEGKKLANTSFTEVKIKGQVMTCKHDGKERSWRLEFGPLHMLKVTELVIAKDAKSAPDKGPVAVGPFYAGCYLASQDFLCIALNKQNLGDKVKPPKDIGANFPRPEWAGLEPSAQPPGPGAGPPPAYNSALVLILRRDK
jgi:hypothetical protein